jgi:hypothetical protein
MERFFGFARQQSMKAYFNCKFKENQSETDQGIIVLKKQSHGDFWGALECWGQSSGHP